MQTTDADNPCPSCGARLDAVFSRDPALIPHAGDLSVCAYCRALLVFLDGVRVRCANTDDWARLTPRQRHDVHTARRLLAQAREEPPI